MNERTLKILAGVVAVLSIVVMIDRPRPPAERSDRVLPGLAASAITRVQIREVVLERKGEGFALTAPRAHEADEAAVRDLLGTLEYLGYRRTVPAAGFAARFTVSVTAGGRTTDLGVGASEPALGLTRVAAGDRVYLVEDWQAHALDRGLDDLRRRDALRVTRPLVFELGGGEKIVVRGDPPCVEVGQGCARADGEMVAGIERALTDLRLTRFLAEGPPSPRARLAAGTETLLVGEACPGAPGEVHVQSPAGAGCLAEDALAPLLARPHGPRGWVDRALLGPGEVKRITIDEGGRQITIDDTTTEGARAWLEELRAFRAPDVISEPPVPPGLPRLTLDDQVLWLGRRIGRFVEVRRADEPVSRYVDADVERFFVADRLPFHDRQILRFEPTALRSVSSRAEEAVRGESIDDWRITRPVALPADLDALEELRRVASSLRAERFVAPAAATAHRLGDVLTFTLDPPPTAPDGAPPETVRLALGADTEGGCFAQHPPAPEVFLLATSACRALRTPLVTREVFTPAGDAVTAITLGESRYQKSASRWHRDTGAPLSDAEGTALDTLVAALREAPAAQAYGPVHPRTKVILETPTEKVELLLAAPVYGLVGRPVRYRLSADACSAWPTVCR